jgi:hypothetical protein
LRARGFFRFERKIAEALTGTHFPWAQDQVVGVHGADRVAVLGEGELDGGNVTLRSDVTFESRTGLILISISSRRITFLD